MDRAGVEQNTSNKAVRQGVNTDGNLVEIAIICITSLWALTNKAGYNFEAALGALWLAVVVYAAVFRRPTLVLVCHLAAVSFPLEYPLIGSLSLYRIALFLSLILLIAHNLGRIIDSAKMFMLYLIMLVMILYAYFFFTQPLTIVGSVVQLKDQYIIWIFYLMLGALCYNDNETYPFHSMFIIGLMITSLNVIYPSETLLVTHKNAEDIRRMAIDTDPNYSAFTFFPGLAYILVRLMIGRKSLMGVVSFLMLTTAIIYGILGTGSRGGLVASIAIAIVVIYNILIRYPAFRQRNLVLCMALFLVGILTVLSDDIFQGRLANKGQGEQTLDAFSSGRIEIWGGYLRSIVQEPTLFGHTGGLVSQGFGPHYAHNAILQLLYDFGMLGSLLWITLLAFSMRGLSRGRTDHLYIVEVGLTIGYGTALMFLTHGGDRQAAIWFGYLAARGARSWGAYAYRNIAYVRPVGST